MLNEKDAAKVNGYDFALKFLQEKLDILSYIKLQSTFDNFKLFYYNEVQQLALKSFRKPNLMSPEDKEIFLLEAQRTKLYLEDEML